MLSHLCFLVLVGCAAVISQEEAPLPSPDFEKKIAAAVDIIKQAAKELENVQGTKDSRDQSLNEYLSSPVSRRSNENLVRKSRDFWGTVWTVAKVAGVAAAVFGK
ncbi:hypothetical protein Bpfe_025322 [Biomphalaria pfeifferi]|uniref:Secreted protein n=1 Tax=Biomphalaria pfeifferi TaxID=112525 RepID=A0AAD8AZI6_BIOPF|nr:hypothetical protein Bpfe_025322 [Biomphalaria pfeifferi]